MNILALQITRWPLQRFVADKANHALCRDIFATALLENFNTIPYCEMLPACVDGRSGTLAMQEAAA